jgi:hypothetical protein
MATSIDDRESVTLAPPPFDRCANCAAELTGEYCQECGQKRIHDNEFSLKVFFGRLINDFTDLDSSKIVRTFVAMVAKPGLLAKEFLGGRRGGFVSPVKLYLTFSAIYFLFAWSALADARGGSAQRAARSTFVVATAKQRGIEPTVLADKIYQKAEKYASALRFGSVLISGLFLAALYFRLKKYYVEHLIFSLYYYSFDFFIKSVFAVAFIGTAAFGVKLSPQILNIFYPVAFIYLLFAIRRVYQQKWTMTVLKTFVLYLCETLLFIAVNIAGFIIAYSTV